MDDVRFDALTRTLGEAMTRRGLTRLLAGLTLGGLLRPTALDAKRRGKDRGKQRGQGHGKGHGTGKKKPGQKNKRDNSRHPRGKDARDQTSADACKAGGVACTAASECCAGVCRFNGTCRCTSAVPCQQPANPCKKAVCSVSGGCVMQNKAAGVACPDDGNPCTRDVCDGSGLCTHPHKTDGTTCSSGTCQNGQCTCPNGTELCANSCVDTQTDPDHCGACGTACEGGSGTCRRGVCATPEVCDGEDNDFDGEIDEGDLCPHNQVCQNGRCICPQGTADCDGDGSCEQLDTNEHCAGCAPCTGGQVCRGGRCDCVPNCQGKVCGADGCSGSCGACDAGQICNADGQCVCDAGFAPCGALCISLNQCCTNGTAKTCPEGQTCCDGGTCAQLGTNQHCAACHDTCGAGQVCQGGACVTPAVCGNGRCDPGETCSSCPGDCGACPGPVCTADTDCVAATCCHPSWCVPVAQQPPCNGVACSGHCQDFTMDCGQGHCACLSGECVAVASEWCGDGVCNGGEDCLSCPDDCGPCPFCGDGVCNESEAGETCRNCPADCGPCPEPECTTWEDCASETCCHLWGCVPLALAPDCAGLACDAGCPSPYDCGMGRCDCRGGMCVAVSNFD